MTNYLLKVYRLRAGPSISHVFYADDWIFMAGTTVHDASRLATLIDAYSYYSGQSVNYNKSQIISCPSTPLLLRLKYQIFCKCPSKICHGNTLEFLCLIGTSNHLIIVIY